MYRCCFWSDVYRLPNPNRTRLLVLQVDDTDPRVVVIIHQGSRSPRSEPGRCTSEKERHHKIPRERRLRHGEVNTE